MKQQKRSKWWRLNASDRAVAKMKFEDQTPKGHRLWTEHEDNLIRRFFPNYGLLGKKLSPRRSYHGIRHRAAKLGLIQTNRRNWTMAELSRLRRLWPTASKVELLAAFDGRTWSSLTGAAHRYHLRRHARPLASSGNPMVDEIRRRALELRLSMSDMDRISNAGRRFFKDAAH